MKVVQINVSIGFGSTGRIVDHIGELIERNGGICYYIHGSRYITHNSPTAIQVGTKLEDYTHYAISLLTGRDGLASIFATKKLVKLLKEIQPDIVHLHNIHGYFINYKILFDYLSNEDIPIVWTFHDCWPITGHCAYFDSVNCKKWQTGCFNCLLLKDYPKSLFFDQSSYNYRLKKSLFTSVKYLTIVPVSDWLGKIVKESYLKDSEIYVIHNGVDTSVFKPEVTDIRKRYKIPNEKKIILGVASGWDERKGYSDFLEIASMEEFQVILVGSIDVATPKLPDNVIHIPNTNNQVELAEFYSAADVFANPTYSDNFPTTNIEALACGTPVVTYNTGGSPEAIDENTGIVVEQGNLPLFIDAIKRMCSISKPISICRERAVTKFNSDERFMDYIKLYNNILTKLKK